MGDIADDCLDQMFDPEWDYDDDQTDGPEFDDCVRFPHLETCYKCGKRGLHWEYVERWVLYHGSEIHMCEPPIDIRSNIEIPS